MKKEISIIVTASQTPSEPIKTVYIDGIQHDLEYIGEGNYLLKNKTSLKQQQKQAKEQ